MKFSKFYYVESIVDIPDYKFRMMDVYDLKNYIKKYLHPIPIEDFKYEYEPDEIVNIKELQTSEGSVGEIRDWKVIPDPDKRNAFIAMFGNYSMKQWWEFLKDISINGIRQPIFITIDKSKIIEGNHRLQALIQLGYDRVPVEYSHDKEKNK